MEDHLKFDFCETYIYPNYMVVVVNEGTTLVPSHNQVLLNIVDTYFNIKKFVYITYRLHSYAVDPAIYRETSKIENLAGFAVVSKNYKVKSNAEIEKLFLNKPFEVFNTLEEAVSWTESIIDS